MICSKVQQFNDLFNEMQHKLCTTSRLKEGDDNEIEKKFSIRNALKAPFVYYEKASVAQIEALYDQCREYWMTYCIEAKSTTRPIFYSHKQDNERCKP